MNEETKHFETKKIPFPDFNSWSSDGDFLITNHIQKIWSPKADINLCKHQRKERFKECYFVITDRAYIGLNEGGYNSISFCLDCFLEKCKKL